MGRVFNGPLFKIDFPSNVSISVRRSLGAMDFSNAGLVKMKAVCDQLKLKYESPITMTDCWAHIGIPRAKVALFLRQSTDIGLFSRKRTEWAKYGWTCLCATTRQIEQTSDEDLAAQLTDALKGASR